MQLCAVTLDLSETVVSGKVMKTLANIVQTWVYFSKDFTFHLSQSLSSTNWVAKISYYTWMTAHWAQLFPKCVMDGLEVFGHQLIKWAWKFGTCAWSLLQVLVPQWGLSSCPCWKEGVAFIVQKAHEPVLELGCFDEIVSAALSESSIPDELCLVG